MFAHFFCVAASRDERKELCDIYFGIKYCTLNGILTVLSANIGVPYRHVCNSLFYVIFDYFNNTAEPVFIGQKLDVEIRINADGSNVIYLDMLSVIVLSGVNLGVSARPQRKIQLHLIAILIGIQNNYKAGQMGISSFTIHLLQTMH